MTRPLQNERAGLGVNFTLQLYTLGTMNANEHVTVTGSDLDCTRVEFYRYTADTHTGELAQVSVRWRLHMDLSRSVLADKQEAFDSMPESLQGGERGQQMEAAISTRTVNVMDWPGEKREGVSLRDAMISKRDVLALVVRRLTLIEMREAAGQ